MLACAVSCAPNTVSRPVPLKQMNQKASDYAAREYTIGPADELDVRFRNNPELNEMRLTVRPDGYINLQIIDEVKAAGLTVRQLKELLTQKYAAELRRPDITVTLRGFAGQRIFIDGEVVLPGQIDLRGPTTITQAIALARGMRETARLSNVIVIRKDNHGQPMAANIDLTKVINGKDMSQDITLLPYDIVYVPKSNIARVDKFVSEYINTAVPGGFPGFAGFSNPYAYSFGGFTKIYPDRPDTATATVVTH